MIRNILAFLRDEEGQTSTEYILLLVVVGMIVFKFKSVAVTKLEALVGKVFDNAETMADQMGQQ